MEPIPFGRIYFFPVHSLISRGCCFSLRQKESALGQTKKHLLERVVLHLPHQDDENGHLLEVLLSLLLFQRQNTGSKFRVNAYFYGLQFSKANRALSGYSTATQCGNRTPNFCSGCL